MKYDVTDYAALYGRILLSLVFLISGYGKVSGFNEVVHYIASRGLPLPQAAAVLAIIVELGAGALLAIGFKTRWASLALAIYTLATAILFHDFWNADVASRLDQTIHFWKDLSICGGMLLSFAFGAGAYALDTAMRSKRRRPASLRAIAP
jgi:putative oxidoreductase